VLELGGIFFEVFVQAGKLDVPLAPEVVSRQWQFHRNGGAVGRRHLDTCLCSARRCLGGFVCFAYNENGERHPGELKLPPILSMYEYTLTTAKWIIKKCNVRTT